MSKNTAVDSNSSRNSKAVQDDADDTFSDSDSSFDQPVSTKSTEDTTRADSKRGNSRSSGNETSGLKKKSKVSRLSDRLKNVMSENEDSSYGSPMPVSKKAR